jgi:hypothetical protein
LTLRELGVHPRQFAVAEGVPVPFGHPKEAFDVTGSRSGGVRPRVENLNVDVSAES